MKKRRFLVWATRGLSALAICSFVISAVFIVITPKVVFASSTCETLNSNCTMNSNDKACCTDLGLICVTAPGDGKCCPIGAIRWESGACVFPPPDNCPDDPLKTEPGACGCGVADTDSDGDGTPNCIDLCPANAPKTAPGVCGCATPDTDNDGDGTPDCNDLCPANGDLTEPGVCGCDTTDADDDGVLYCVDGCDNDPLKTSPGFCGCGVPDTDSDNDGAPDCLDECPNNGDLISVGVCGCDTTDTDSDGTYDCVDGCPTDVNKLAAGICGCGVADTDSDGDGTANCVDDCPADPNKIEVGICGCGVSDADFDGDGNADCTDMCPEDPLKVAPGICGCGFADVDTDLDGAFDCDETCDTDPAKTAPGQCGCGVPDTDTDDDGVADCLDECPLDAEYTELGEGMLMHEGHCYPYENLSLIEPVTCSDSTLHWSLYNPNAFSVAVIVGGDASGGATIPAGGSATWNTADGPTARSFTWTSIVGNGSSQSSLDCTPGVVDLCLNIDGVQTQVPAGYVRYDGLCVPGGEPPIPVTGAGGPLIIPVTGVDFALNYAMAQQLALNLGLVFSGLAMMSAGLAKKSKDED